jgi:hypothetical protein
MFKVRRWFIAMKPVFAKEMETEPIPKRLKDGWGS